MRDRWMGTRRSGRSEGEDGLGIGEGEAGTKDVALGVCPRGGLDDEEIRAVVEGVADAGGEEGGLDAAASSPREGASTEEDGDAGVGEREEREGASSRGPGVEASEEPGGVLAAECGAADVEEVAWRGFALVEAAADGVGPGFELVGLDWGHGDCRRVIEGRGEVGA